MKPALPIIGFISGLLFIYISLFVYEDEQQKIQNILEHLWVRVDDARKNALSRHMAFIHAVAGMMTKAFDRVLGEKPFSIQSIGVSACYAIASLNLFLFFLTRSEQNSGSHYRFFASFLFALAFGTIPSFLREKYWTKVWFALFLYLALIKFIVPFLYMTKIGSMSTVASSNEIHDMVIFPIIIIFGVILGVATFTFSILIMRKSLQKITISQALARGGFILLLNLIPVLILYGLFRLTEYSMISDNQIQGADVKGLFTDFNTSVSSALLFLFIIAIYINTVFFVSASIFLLLSVTMFVHRLLWPLLNRPIYALQKLGIAKRSKLLGAIGASLLMTSIGGLRWLEKIVEKLNPW